MIILGKDFWVNSSRLPYNCKWKETERDDNEIYIDNNKKVTYITITVRF